LFLSPSEYMRSKTSSTTPASSYSRYFLYNFSAVRESSMESWVSVWMWSLRTTHAKKRRESFLLSGRLALDGRAHRRYKEVKPLGNPQSVQIHRINDLVLRHMDICQRLIESTLREGGICTDDPEILRQPVTDKSAS